MKQEFVRTENAKRFRAEILEVKLPKPRDRLRLAGDPQWFPSQLKPLPL